MATAYSTLLGLALPVQGELSGTWGDMVDNGITRYVDIAVAGTVTLTNDGAVSLSLTNGDSSATNIVSSLTGAGTVSAQFAIIKVTGTLTTAKILTPPSSSRTYVVVNAATGSTVTVKASGQTGVSIAVGETAFVYFNGTDYVKVAGTVNTGVTSFQTSLSGLTPSTSTTGAVTLAGTLGTSSGGTNLTSFTSGGVVYASSSSALATGSNLYLTGTTLNVVGTNASINIDGGGVGGIGNTLGVVGTSYGYVGTTTSTPLVFNTSNTERARISSGGDVSIGTTTAAGKLNVAGQITATTGIFKATGAPSLSAATSGEAILAPEGTYGSLLYGYGSTYDVTISNRTTTPALAVLANSTNVYMAGNVGIGTTTPVAKLHLKGSGTSGQVTASWILENASSGASGMDITGSAGASRWRFLYTGAGPSTGTNTFSEAMCILTEGASAGNLGIGTSSPNYKLQLNNSASGGSNYLQITHADAGTANTDGLVIGLATGSSPDAYIAQKENAPLIFQTNSAERARISAAGGFSVGTTADPGAGAIYATGNITAYYSDARLKTVSGKIENALDKVAQLSGVYYTNNSVAKSFGYDSDEVQVGVLAQDVEAVLPQIVKAAPFDLDADGNSKSGENYKTVQYERLVPLLIEAINELQAKVKALESK